MTSQTGTVCTACRTPTGRRFLNPEMLTRDISPCKLRIQRRTITSNTLVKMLFKQLFSHPADGHGVEVRRVASHLPQGRRLDSRFARSGDLVGRVKTLKFSLMSIDRIELFTMRLAFLSPASLWIASCFRALKNQGFADLDHTASKRGLRREHLLAWSCPATQRSLGVSLLDDNKRFDL